MRNARCTMRISVDLVWCVVINRHAERVILWVPPYNGWVQWDCVVRTPVISGWVGVNRQYDHDAGYYMCHILVGMCNVQGMFGHLLLWVPYFGGLVRSSYVTGTPSIMGAIKYSDVQ